MEPTLTPLGEMLLAGQTDPLVAALLGALEAGETSRALLDAHLMPAMELLGRRFADGEAFLPELLLAADTMKGAMDAMTPFIRQEGAGQAGATLLLGTVQGDIHDLGKNLVKVMFEGAGFRVVDLGNNVPLERFLAAVAEEKPDLVGLSSLLSNTMLEMKRVIEAVRDEHPQTRFIVGGAPLTDDYAKEIGADGYAPNAYHAVGVGRTVLGLA